MIIMKKTYQKLDRGLTLLENFFVLISSLLLFIMIGIIALSVVGRSFFNSPFAWSVEFSEYILLYITLFSASWILRQGDHVKLELVVDLFKEKQKRIFYLISFSLCLIACLNLSWFSLHVTLDYFQRGLILLKLVHMPNYIVILPLFIGAIMLSLRFLIILINTFTKKVENN